jgi:polyphosphate kinase
VDECLVAYLHDEVDAWNLTAQGEYVRSLPAAGTQGHGAQQALMARYSRNIERQRG